MQPTSIVSIKVIAIAIILFVLTTTIAHAWTGPSASPPNGNVPAPVNVGSAEQIKDGTLGVGGLAVFGNTSFLQSSYLNFGSTIGYSGYGFRDASGTLQFKNSGGNWSSIEPPVCYGGSKALQWNGTAWSCKELIRECRVCIRLTSNSSIDGDQECSAWSSGGTIRYTGSSGWAQANTGYYGGGKYASQAWLQCR